MFGVDNPSFIFHQVSSGPATQRNHRPLADVLSDPHHSRATRKLTQLWLLASQSLIFCHNDLVAVPKSVKIGAQTLDFSPERPSRRIMSQEMVRGRIKAGFDGGRRSVVGKHHRGALVGFLQVVHLSLDRKKRQIFCFTCHKFLVKLMWELTHGPELGVSFSFQVSRFVDHNSVEKYFNKRWNI